MRKFRFGVAGSLLSAAGFSGSDAFVLPTPIPRKLVRTPTLRRYREQSDPSKCPVDPDDTIEDLDRLASDDYISSVVDQVTSFAATSPIIRPYKPNRFWLWRQWSGTILQHGCKKALILMSMTAIVSLLLRRISGGSWVLSGKLAADSALTVRLDVFNKMWHYCMTFTTFVLTFFVTQAYSFWRNMYNTARKIQGRLNDLGLLLATHAERDDEGKYTKEGVEFLDEVSQYVRLYSVFTWASTSRRFRVLLTTRAMKQMVQKGFMTQLQIDTLLSLRIPRTQYISACLEWIVARVGKASREGILVQNEALDRTIYDKACVLRGTQAGIGDELDGRMPLVYAHFLQILMDWFVLGAPLALFDELGSMSILCVGMLTLFYEGFLDLAKVFLDPLENEDYCDGGIEMNLAVLMQETNAGSMRWKNGAEKLPFAA